MFGHQGTDAALSLPPAGLSKAAEHKDFKLPEQKSSLYCVAPWVKACAIARSISPPCRPLKMIRAQPVSPTHCNTCFKSSPLRLSHLESNTNKPHLPSKALHRDSASCTRRMYLFRLFNKSFCSSSMCLPIVSSTSAMMGGSFSKSLAENRKRNHAYRRKFNSQTSDNMER